MMHDEETNFDIRGEISTCRSLVS